jgi:hypothetical protein
MPTLSKPAALNRRARRALAGLLLGLHCLAAPAADPAGAAQAMADAALAERLTSLALQQRDPLLLAMAARLQWRSAGRPTERRSQTPVRRPDPDAVVRHPRHPMALLALARSLARGRTELLALLDDVAQERPRGVEDGPRSQRVVAPPLAKQVYPEVFRPGEPARVLIAGDGQSNLDLYVFDEQGRRLCASEELDDVEECQWQPQQGRRFLIHVVNRGRTENQYHLRSN